jgi:predicted Zn-dependent peptidase
MAFAPQTSYFKEMARQPRFNKTVMDNGLTVLSERLGEFRSLSLGVWVKIGTRNETPPVAGVSHFLEHMLFKGTKNRTPLQIATEVDQVGGEFNAFTAREHTCFHLLLLDRDCNLGLDILSDVLMNSQFKEEEFERERKVILQEISMVEESPEEMAHDIFFEMIYGSHGLGKPILGTEASIKKMKRTDLVEFFRHHYRPEQLVLSVAGDIHHGDIKRKIKPLSRDKWPGRALHGNSQSKGRQLSQFSKAPLIKSGFWWVERPTEQVHLLWGVQGPNYASKDRFAAFLLNVYLGGGMSSTLFQEIREKNGLMDSGVFTIYAATGMGQVPLCLKLIERCVEQIKEKLLSKEELRVIQNNLKGTILLSSDSVESRMSSIARNEMCLGQYQSIQEVCRQIDEVTPADLRRVARNLFQNDERSILALGPKASKVVATKLRPEVLRQYCRT